MPDESQYLAAICFDDGRRVPLERMTERIVSGDEEPGVPTLPDHGLARRLGQSIGIIGPVHASRRARFAGQIRRARGGDEKNAIPLPGNLLNGERDGGHRNVNDGVDALLIEPLARNIRADVRLVLMVSRDDLDFSPQHGATKIFYSELRGDHGAYSAQVRVKAGH